MRKTFITLSNADIYKCSIFLCFALLLASCHEESDIQEVYSSQQITVVDGRLAFENKEAYGATIMELSKLNDVDLKKFERSYEYNSIGRALRQNNNQEAFIKDNSFDSMSVFNDPVMLTLLNEKSCVQVGDSIHLFKSNTLYTFHKDRAELIDKSPYKLSTLYETKRQPIVSKLNIKSLEETVEHPDGTLEKNTSNVSANENARWGVKVSYFDNNSNMFAWRATKINLGSGWQPVYSGGAYYYPSTPNGPPYRWRRTNADWIKINQVGCTDCRAFEVKKPVPYRETNVDNITHQSWVLGSDQSYLGGVFSVYIKFKRPSDSRTYHYVIGAYVYDNTEYNEFPTCGC